MKSLFGQLFRPRGALPLGQSVRQRLDLDTWSPGAVYMFEDVPGELVDFMACVVAPQTKTALHALSRPTSR